MQTIIQNTRSDTISRMGTPVLTYTIHYPSFTTTCSEEAADAISRFYADRAREAEDFCRTTLSSQALMQAEHAKKEGFPFFEYEFLSGFTVTYDADCFVSLYTDQYLYTGGAHGTTQRTSETWDFSSGKRLSLSDFYPNSPSYQERILKNLQRQVSEREKRAPYTYFDDYASLLRSTFNPESFYMTPKGIVIYYQQYDIAPYSTGLPEFLLPFRKRKS